MLVLTRKTGQQLMLGEDIVVTVLEITGDRIRVGIEAPRHVQIFRPEAVEQLSKENLLASSARPRLQVLTGGLAGCNPLSPRR